MNRHALILVADQGPAETTAAMLRGAGWECARPGAELLGSLRKAGIDVGLQMPQLAMHGYEPPALPETEDEGWASMVVDAHLPDNHDRHRLPCLWLCLRRRPPSLPYELAPPWPTLSFNRFHRRCPGVCYAWPRFARAAEFSLPRDPCAAAVCLVNDVRAVNLGWMVDAALKMDVRFFGRGAPNGCLGHGRLPGVLSQALALVHMKDSDAGGWAILEAAAASCPLVLPWVWLARSDARDVFVPGKSCLAFADADDLARALERLKDPAYNRLMGEEGKMAAALAAERYDGGDFGGWMRRNFW